MEAAISVCPSCGNTVFPTDKFCPNCGILLTFGKTFSLGKKIWIYFVSLFLPPFGFVWTFKYFRSSNPEQKKVAIIAAVLTIISIVINVWFIWGIIAQAQQQMSQIQNLGL